MKTIIKVVALIALFYQMVMLNIQNKNQDIVSEEKKDDSLVKKEDANKDVVVARNETIKNENKNDTKIDDIKNRLSNEDIDNQDIDGDDLDDQDIMDDEDVDDKDYSKIEEFDEDKFKKEIENIKKNVSSSTILGNTNNETLPLEGQKKEIH